MAVELEKIISVAGKGGLFKLITGGKATIIAESLVDGKKQPIHNTSKVSSLSDISIFCLEEDVPLRTVFLKMKDLFVEQEVPDPKGDQKVLRTAMKQLLPDYDEERVYDSDIRKLFTWFSILKSKDMLEFAEPAKEEEEAPHAEADHEENVL